MAPLIDTQHGQQASNAAAISTQGSSSSILTTTFPVVCIVMAFIFILGIQKRLQVCSIARRVQQLLALRATSTPAALPPGPLHYRDVDTMRAIEYVYSSPSPSLKGKDANVSCERDLACAICTEDFVSGTVVRELHCGHLFHKKCIDLWFLDQSATCPLWYAYSFRTTTRSITVGHTLNDQAAALA